MIVIVARQCSRIGRGLKSASVLFAVFFFLSMVACSDLHFRPQNLVKSDIDLVADLHYRQGQSLLRELTHKLYKRNPQQLRRSPGYSVEQRLEQLFSQPGYITYEDLSLAGGTGALELALAPGYQGDRVMATMAGLNGMIRNAYGYKDEFFLFDRLDQQKLYDSARNIEILIWRLARGGDNGKPLLLTNNLPGEPVNLSFARLFGKLIASQDMMARVVALQNERLINRTAQNVAALAFFPL
ncbi:hypothetical protein A9Q90_00550 [Gammaproteobacteria bacterium 54_18_T64]|nr:hypothetical protein A9Q90_00550 [Gammaproteobacteria bacterium 54_18_T64]